MSVLAEAISVVVQLSTLNTKYPGGADQYQRDCLNNSYCADQYLARVGFMTPADVKQFVAHLENSGMVFVRDGRVVDIAVVDQFQGLTAPCDWLGGGRHPDGYSAVWYAGTIPGFLSVPPGWTLEQSRKMSFTANVDVDKRFIRLQSSDQVDTLLDFKTGKEVYHGRVYPTDPEPTDPDGAV